MDDIVLWSQRKLANTELRFKRFLFDRINWEARLVILIGARGVGKTTLLLQHLKSLKLSATEALYLSMDNLYFSKTSLLDFVEDFVNRGGKFLYLDEIQKYENWSIELKNIYDNYPDLFLRISGSSATEILRSEGDLSRRALYYILPGLSFREYLDIVVNISLPTVDIDEIVNNHEQLAHEMIKDFRVLPFFKNYLESGFYPFILEGEDGYHQRIRQIVNVTLEVDIPAVFGLDYAAVRKLKRLLALMADKVPFKPNVKRLSEVIGISRESLLRYLRYLEKAELIQMLFSSSKGVSSLNKPEKIYLNNVNLAHALGFEVNLGNSRETFFYNQLKVLHELSAPPKADFLIDDKYLFEVGGKNKKFSQIAGEANAYLAVDDLEFSTGRKIPLWMFGLLY